MPKKTRHKPKDEPAQTEQATGWDPVSGRHSASLSRQVEQLTAAYRVGPDYPCGTCLFFVGREEHLAVTRGRCHQGPEPIAKFTTDWCGRRRPKPDGESLVE